MSSFGVVKTYLTVIAWSSWHPYCPASISPPLQSGGEFIHHHCFLQLPINTASNESKEKMKQKGNKNRNTHEVSQYRHCCACNLHPHFSAHFLGGKSPCLGNKCVTPQGTDEESTASQQLRLNKTTVQWKAISWRHDQCSPHSSQSTPVLTEMGDITLESCSTC